MPSKKTPVVEHIFRKNWDQSNQTLTKSLVTQTEVADAINHCNKVHGSNLSARNPANFMKDMVRKQTASNNWPDFLKAQRYTAVQRAGEEAVFEFVPYRPGQIEPFPDTYKPTAATRRIEMQSVSMPLASKRLGRSDEPWIVQTSINLRVVETHLAVVSSMQVLEITHLQMSVKLHDTEIDAIFLATCQVRDQHVQVIVTCEAKQEDERILEHQIVSQVRAAFEETDVGIVIPIGVRAVRNVGVYLVEFAAISRKDAITLHELQVASEAVYEFKPPVTGI